MDIYERIDKILKVKRLSRRKLAALAGIPYPTLAASFKRKSKKPSFEFVAKISNALKTTPFQLVGEEFWGAQFHNDTPHENMADGTEGFVNYIRSLGYLVSIRKVDALIDNEARVLEYAHTIVEISKNSKTFELKKGEFEMLQQRTKESVRFYLWEKEQRE